MSRHINSFTKQIAALNANCHSVLSTLAICCCVLAGCDNRGPTEVVVYPIQYREEFQRIRDVFGPEFDLVESEIDYGKRWGFQTHQGRPYVEWKGKRSGWPVMVWWKENNKLQKVDLRIFLGRRYRYLDDVPVEKEESLDICMDFQHEVLSWSLSGPQKGMPLYAKDIVFEQTEACMREVWRLNPQKTERVNSWCPMSEVSSFMSLVHKALEINGIGSPSRGGAEPRLIDAGIV